MRGQATAEIHGREQPVSTESKRAEVQTSSGLDNYISTGKKITRTVTADNLSLYTRISKGKEKAELTASTGGGLALTN